MVDVFYVHSRQHCYDRYGKDIDGIPQSESLARLMISMLYGTAEILSFPQKRGMETKTKKCVRNSNEWQEVRHSHIIAEVCESRWRKGLCTL